MSRLIKSGGNPPGDLGIRYYKSFIPWSQNIDQEPKECSHNVRQNSIVLDLHGLTDIIS